jgi:invasion protein IalB
MAARVVLEYAEVRREIGNLRVPHAVVLAQGMREHEDGAIVRARQAVERCGVGEFQ